MTGTNRYLSIALVAFGAIFCLIYPLAMYWPSGWAWHEGAPVSNDYFMMIVAIYATLGLFLIRAAKRPLQHASLIWFTVWSSIVHAVVMALQASSMPMKHGHLMGDVPALLLVAAVLAILLHRLQRENATPV